MGEYVISAIIEKEEDMYVSHCPELGIASQGKTIDLAIANLREAAELYLKYADKEELARLKKHRHEPIMSTISVGRAR